MFFRRLLMAQKRKRRRRSALPLWITLLLFVAAVCITLVLEMTWLTNIFGESEPTTALPPPPPVTEGTVEIHMIDVGQGDCILVKTPDKNLLFDAGQNNKEVETAIKTYFEAEGVTHIDHFILTHPDSDHIGSADMVISTYSVGEVIMEPYTYSSETGVYKDLITEINKKNIPVKDPSDGEVITVGELQMTVLGPTKDFKNKNENSIVMRLDFGENSILMTGDAEKKSEAAILEKYGAASLDCDVLKVGHHGSDTSTSDSFLAAVSPEIALISSNPKGNTFGHPKPVTIDKLNTAGIAIYRTDTLGDIVLIFDGEKITVEQ